MTTITAHIKHFSSRLRDNFSQCVVNSSFKFCTWQQDEQSNSLNKISHIHWHFINSSVVKCLNILQGACIILRDKVNRYSFTAKPSSSSNPVDKRRKIIRTPAHFKVRLAKVGQPSYTLTFLSNTCSIQSSA